MSSKYDSTISNSKEDSINKALQILLTEQEEADLPIKRPGISLRKILRPHLYFIAIYVCMILGGALVVKLKSLQAYYIFVPISFVIIIAVFRVKKVIIDAILVYQQYAPENVRRACVFVPSCSEYMLMSIEKYGVIKGVIKGIGRLLRCHIPNGGVDYP